MQCKSLAKVKYINIYINLVVQAKFVAFAKLICGIKCRESSRKCCYYYISLQTYRYMLLHNWWGATLWSLKNKPWSAERKKCEQIKVL